MKLPSYVKPYPNLLWKLPFMKAFGANAIYPNIYVNHNIYADLISKKPKTRYIGLLKHEEFHLKREKQIGRMKFGLKYLTLPKFRFNEELLAYKVDMKYLKENKEKFNIDLIAKYLSGPIYLYSTNYENAKKQLEKAWEEA